MREFIRLKRPLICLVTKGNLTDRNFSKDSEDTLRIIKTATACGINLIQIREKNLSAAKVFELTARAAQITRETPTGILVNERADIALAANAGGVHLRSDSLPTKAVRRAFPDNFIIGVSTHSLEKARLAAAEGADFVTFSPVFPTISKPVYGQPQGLAELQAVCVKLKPFPVVALGGIDGTNYQSVLQNGAAGFAGIGFFNNTQNLRKLPENLRK